MLGCMTVTSHQVAPGEWELEAAGVDRRARERPGRTRRRDGQVAARPASARTVPQGHRAHRCRAQHAVPQLDLAGRPAALSGRHRTRKPNREHPALECGRHGAQGLRRRLRRGRPHRHLPVGVHDDGGRPQSRLPKPERDLRRRPGPLPGAHVARHLCARLPRGTHLGGGTEQLPSRVGRRRRPAVVSAPAPHAVVLADALRQHGSVDAVGDLPGAVREVPRASRAQEGQRGQDLGLHRGRRVRPSPRCLERSPSQPASNSTTSCWP